MVSITPAPADEALWPPPPFLGAQLGHYRSFYKQQQSGLMAHREHRRWIPKKLTDYPICMQGGPAGNFISQLGCSFPMNQFTSFSLAPGYLGCGGHERSR